MHAHLCAVGGVGAVAGSWMTAATFPGIAPALQETSAPGARSILFAAMLLWLAAMVVRASLADNGAAVGLVFLPLVAMMWVGTPGAMEAPVRAVSTVVGLLALTLLCVRSSVNKVRRGDTLQRTGPFTAADHTYYQRQGVL